MNEKTWRLNVWTRDHVSEFNQFLHGIEVWKLVTITMNMCWFLLLIIFMVWSAQNRSTIRKTNLIVIECNHSDTRSKPRLVYSSDQFKSLRSECSARSKHRRLTSDYGAIRKIKTLRINKRRIRLQCGEKLQRRKQNLNDIIEVQWANPLEGPTSRSIIVATVNARSVKGKIVEIQCQLLIKSIDILLVTESWLQESDDTWLKAQGWSRIG